VPNPEKPCIDLENLFEPEDSDLKNLIGLEYSDLENLIVSEYTEEEHEPGEVPEFEAEEKDDDDDEFDTSAANHKHEELKNTQGRTPGRLKKYASPSDDVSTKRTYDVFR
jgi:hypothetical protein